MPAKGGGVNVPIARCARRAGVREGPLGAFLTLEWPEPA